MSVVFFSGDRSAQHFNRGLDYSTLVRDEEPHYYNNMMCTYTIKI